MSPNRPGYQNLNKVKDPALREALKIIYDRVGSLEGLSAGIGAVSAPLGDHLDSAGHRMIDLADPVAGTDAVNLQTLQRVTNTAVRQALLDAGLITPPPSGGGPGRGTGGGAGGGNAPLPPVPPPNPNDPAPQEGNGIIRCGGLAFHYTDGTIWPWKGSTDARLFEYYITGVDIGPVVAERIALGANLFRVFGMYDPGSFIGDFNPASYGNYYTALGSFCDYLAAQGAWLEFTCFTGAGIVMPGQTAQVDHYNAVCAVLQTKPMVFLEVGNEWENNGIVPERFGRPAGLLTSRASAIIGHMPYRPAFDYCTHHGDRTEFWPRAGKELLELRDGFENWSGVRRPVVADEPMGAAETPSSNRSDVPVDFFYFAAGCMLLGAGATFHSSNGLQSVLFQPITSQCAQQFYAGLTAVPAYVQTWTYTNFGFSDFPLDSPPDFLKCYGKVNDPGGDAWVVAIRPGGTWAPVGRNGWTIVGLSGPNNCVVHLTR